MHPPNSTPPRVEGDARLDQGRRQTRIGELVHAECARKEAPDVRVPLNLD